MKTLSWLYRLKKNDVCSIIIYASSEYNKQIFARQIGATKVEKLGHTFTVREVNKNTSISPTNDVCSDINIDRINLMGTLEKFKFLIRFIQSAAEQTIDGYKFIYRKVARQINWLWFRHITANYTAYNT